MSDKKDFLKSTFEMLATLKYIEGIRYELMEPEQQHRLNQEIDETVNILDINMHDSFPEFMDSVTTKLKAEDCDFGEKEFKTNSDFAMCISSFKTIGLSQIDEMFYE